MMISSVDGKIAISNASSQAPQASAETNGIVKKAHGGSGAVRAKAAYARSSNKNNNTPVADKSSAASSGVELIKKSDQSVDIKLPGSSKDDGSAQDTETYYPADKFYVPTSFAELAAQVGGSTKNVTKQQLESYLKSITSDASEVSAAEITVVKNLIAQFEHLSGGTGTISSFDGLKEPQDYKTITKEQVTLPVDVRV